MLNESELAELKKEETPARAASLSAEEIAWLVDLLSSKDDKVRYGAFLLLNERSLTREDVFLFWDVFTAKLGSDNSYQRSLGVMLLAANARWDGAGKTAAVLENVLAILKDEKPITVRQCVQSLAPIVSSHPELSGTIAKRLTSLDLTEIRETMRKLVLIDIVDVLLLIRETVPGEAIDSYLFHALSGELLDAKTKKRVLARMGSAVRR